MSLTPDDYRLLRAAEQCGRDVAEAYSKCAVVLRRVLDEINACNAETEVAICNSGYEDGEVARLYDTIRNLVKQRLLEGRGDFELPAGPRYTECRITSAGMLELHGTGKRGV